MWIRRPTSLALQLCLVLASTAGLAAHDHLSAPERGEAACAVDHHGEPGATETAGAELRRTGQPHQHVCLGCRTGTHRSLVVSCPSAEVGLAPGQDAPARPSAAPRVFFRSPGHTLRGPPAA